MPWSTLYPYSAFLILQLPPCLPSQVRSQDGGFGCSAPACPACPELRGELRWDPGRVAFKSAVFLFPSGLAAVCAARAKAPLPTPSGSPVPTSQSAARPRTATPRPH